jgi:hypothetical protein
MSGVADDVRKVAKGWRWGRRPLVPRSAEQYVVPVRPTAPRTAWSRTRAGRAAREVVQKGLLEPVFRSQVRPTVEGLDVLTDLTGPVIFAANHASHLDTPLILLSLPDAWRRRTCERNTGSSRPFCTTSRAARPARVRDHAVRGAVGRTGTTYCSAERGTSGRRPHRQPLATRRTSSTISLIARPRSGAAGCAGR